MATPRGVLPFLLLVPGLFVVRDARAVCTDPDAVAAVRARIQAQCDCATAVSRSAYSRCVKAVTKTAVLDGELPSSCAGAVKRCASKSTCGRPGGVTCLQTASRGTKCSIKKDASKCAAPGSCIGAVASCCDAAAGCAGGTTTATTAPPASCGDGSVGPGETCDPPGSLTCPPGSATGAFLCNGDCTCPSSPPTTTTTMQTPATTTTTVPPAPLVCTDPLIGLPPLARVPITVIAGSTNCGGVALDPPPSPPFSGEVDRADGGKLSDLGTGCLHFGTGQNMLLPGGRIPDGAKLVVSVVGVSGLRVVLGPSAGSSMRDCTRPAGPGRHCLNGGPGTDGNGACAQDQDCGPGAPGRCTLDANCFFGPPLPLAVPTAPALSVCVVNAFDQGACGDMNLLSRSATFSAGVSARAYLTGNAESPCPRCVSGRCDGGKRAGATCQAVGSAGTSIDCPPADNLFQGALPVVLQGGSTEPTALVATDGKFCAGQGVIGAFGRTDATRIATRGMRLNPLGLLSQDALLTVAAPFCITATGSPVIDGTVGLPGPGVFSVATRLELGDLLGLLGLPLLP
jgi:hypothetical protein